MHIILFDIDGTLLRGGSKVGIPATQYAFQTLLGAEISYEGISLAGRTDPLIFQEISERCLGRHLSDEELAEVQKLYIEENERLFREPHPITRLDGALEVVTRLAGMKDVHLGLETGNVKEVALLKVGSIALGTHLTRGGFGCDSPDRRDIVRIAAERVALDEGFDHRGATVVVIGDAPQDIDAAKYNGYRSIAVGTGALNVEALQAYEPDVALAGLHVPELFDYIL